MSQNESRQAVDAAGGREWDNGGGQQPLPRHNITISSCTQVRPVLSYGESLRAKYQCSLGDVYLFLLSRRKVAQPEAELQADDSRVARP